MLSTFTPAAASHLHPCSCEPWDHAVLCRAHWLSTSSLCAGTGGGQSQAKAGDFSLLGPPRGPFPLLVPRIQGWFLSKASSLERGQCPCLGTGRNSLKSEGKPPPRPFTFFFFLIPLFASSSLVLCEFYATCFDHIRLPSPNSSQVPPFPGHPALCPSSTPKRF